MRPALSAVILLWSLLCSRADPEPELQQPAWRLHTWETEDGLPHNSVTGVVQQSDGFLWVSTLGGVARFDGLQFSPVRDPLVVSEKTSTVRGLARENSRSLVLVSVAAGLVRLQDGIATPHPAAKAVPDAKSIERVCAESDNIFWLLRTDRELLRWDHGHLERFPAPPRGMSVARVSFGRDRSGRFHISRGLGIERYVDGRLVTVASGPGRPFRICGSATGGIWLSTASEIYRFDGDEAVPQWVGAGTREDPPSALSEGPDGALWAARPGRGLCRWDGKSETVVAPAQLRITDVCQDSEGNLWTASTGGGLTRLQPSRFTIFEEDRSAAVDMTASVCEDRLGHVWLFSRNSIRRIADAKMTTLSGKPGWPDRGYPVCPDAEGAIWFAAGRRLFRARGDHDDPPAVVEDQGPSPIRVLHVARDGALWIGRLSGLERRTSSEQRHFSATDGYTGQTVQAIAEDAAGRVWIGTAEGELFEHGPHGFRRYAAADGVPPTAIRAIHADADGGLWIGTGGAGLLHRKDGKIGRVTRQNGLPDDVVSQILEDEAGWLWFGSTRGLFKIRKADLAACAAGVRPGVEAVAFGRAEGLSGASAVGSYQPTAWKTRRGRFWFATRKGFVTTDPAEHPSDRPPPPVSIERVVADGTVLAGDAPVVPPGTKRLEIHFVAPSLSAPERVRYRYRLQDFDSRWTEPGTGRVAVFSTLPAGAYRFDVSAGYDDTPARAASEMTFVVEPFWWERGWARTAFCLLALGVIGGTVRLWSARRYRARLARVEQERRIEAERARIARDLHDDLGASLTEVGIIASELAEDSSHSAIAGQSAELAERVRTVARDLDAAVWAVSPRHDSLPSLCDYLCQYTQEYVGRAGLRCRLHRPAEIPDLVLSPDARHNIFLFAREALNNVVKHARAQQVDLTLGYSAGCFSLSLSDDGRGFDPADVAHSERSGLRNLRARAAESGGDCAIESSAAGTQVTLRLRLPLKPPTRASR